MLRHVVSGIEKEKAADEDKKSRKKIKTKLEFTDRYKHSNSGSKNYSKVNTWTLPSLCQAVCEKDVNKVIQLLMLDSRKHLYERDNNNRTALHYASYHDHYGILALLLESKYSGNLLEAKDDTGKTPLFKASETSAIASLKLLLSFGCNPTTYDMTGTTPLHVAVLAQNDALMDILLSAKANSNSIDQLGFSPLHICCGLGFVDGIRLLLLHNANPNSRDRKGRTPLFAAATENRSKVIKLLLKHGANPNVLDDEGAPIAHINSTTQKTLQSDQKQRRRSERRSVHMMGTGEIVANDHRRNSQLINKYDKEIMKAMSPRKDFETDSDTNAINSTSNVIPPHFQNNAENVGATVETLLPGYVPLTRNRNSKNKRISPKRMSSQRKVDNIDSMVANHPHSDISDGNSTDISISLGSETVHDYSTVVSPRQNLTKSSRILSSGAGLLNESEITSDDELIKMNDYQATTEEDSLAIPFEQKKMQYLYEKNCELLGKKLKRCKTLQTRMSGLIVDLELPRPPGSGTNGVAPDNVSLHEENDVLHNEILTLRQKNAELSNNAFQYKQMRMQQNATVHNDTNINDDIGRQDVIGNHTLGNLQQTIQELVKENLKIKEEVRNLNSQLSFSKPQTEELAETKKNLSQLTQRLAEDKAERENLSKKIEHLQVENINLSGRLSMLSNSGDDRNSVVSKPSYNRHRPSSNRHRKSRRAPLPPPAAPVAPSVPTISMKPATSSVPITPIASTEASIDPQITEIKKKEVAFEDTPSKVERVRKPSIWDSIKRELPKLRKAAAAAAEKQQQEEQQESSQDESEKEKQLDSAEKKVNNVRSSNRSSKLWKINM